MLNRLAVEIHTLPVPPGLFPKHPPFEGMLRPLYSSQRQDEEPPNILGHIRYFRKRFCKSTSFFVSSVFSGIKIHPNGIHGEKLPKNQSTSLLQRKWKTKARLRSEMPVRTVSQKFSSLQWRRLFKNYGADQQRLQISDLHFDKFPTPATFSCWKIRFKTEVCTCSQFPTEAMQWIKEVELADSVDDF